MSVARRGEISQGTWILMPCCILSITELLQLSVELIGLVLAGYTYSPYIISRTAVKVLIEIAKCKKAAPADSGNLDYKRGKHINPRTKDPHYMQTKEN